MLMCLLMKVNADSRSNWQKKPDLNTGLSGRNIHSILPRWLTTEHKKEFLKEGKTL